MNLDTLDFLKIVLFQLDCTDGYRVQCECRSDVHNPPQIIKEIPFKKLGLEKNWGYQKNLGVPKKKIWGDQKKLGVVKKSGGSKKIWE